MLVWGIAFLTAGLFSFIAASAFFIPSNINMSKNPAENSYIFSLRTLITALISLATGNTPAPDFMVSRVLQKSMKMVLASFSSTDF